MQGFVMKRGNTSNLLKQLKDRHLNLFKEFKQQQAEEGVQHERPQQTYTQTTVAEAFLRQLKYDKNSPEARKLNQAVAEFMYGCLYGCICMDVYTANSKALQPKVPASKPKLFNVH